MAINFNKCMSGKKCCFQQYYSLPSDSVSAVTVKDFSFLLQWLICMGYFRKTRHI